MQRTELAQHLRRAGETTRLSFSNPLHAQWLSGMYGGAENVHQRLPLLDAAWKRTAAQPPQNDQQEDCFADGNEINLIQWRREDNMLIIEALTSLTAPAIFIDECLEVRTAAGEVVAGFAQSTLNTCHTKLVLQTDFDPSCFQSDVLELDYTSNWASAANGLLTASMHSRDIHTRALLSSTVKAVHPFSPRKKTAGKTAPINICYNRWPIQTEDIDYIYQESFDPVTKLQRLYAPLCAWVEFEDNSDPFSTIDMATFVLKLDCQNGIAKYTKTGRETSIQAHFCKGPEKDAQYPNGFYFELDPNWMENVPSSRLPKRDRVDIYFAVEYICQSGQRGSVQISSTVKPPVPANVGTVDYINLLWGCVEKGTTVLMVDGTTKPIEYLQIGERLRGKNGHGVCVENIYRGLEHDPMVILHTANAQRLACTADHPVVTTQGMVQACHLTGESCLYGENGETIALDGIWDEAGDHEVYSLSVEDGEFYAQGILVGDFTVQGQLGRVPQACCDDAYKIYEAECELKRALWRELI